MNRGALKAKVCPHASSESMEKITEAKVEKGTHVTLPIIPFRILLCGVSEVQRSGFKKLGAPGL
jgi:hypothetical protein